MRVRVLYFARSREAAGGAGEEALELPEGSTTAQLLDLLRGRHPALESVLRACVLAVNQEYVGLDAALPLKEGDEVALIPPLSGG
ncbi:MAG: ThiamineS/Molybdopterin converting factor subunit 1 [Monoraphidium minutum]|nr:MAG: ThiamineS/Molybdopterin converting factor subunit 1 [Monoraphidium minutum]